MTRETPGPTWLYALLVACGGFLISTLWFDLMFDVQVLGHAAAPAPLPDAVLGSIAHYYRRVTTDAHPMQRLVGAVMAVAVFGSAWTLRHASPRPLHVLGFVAAALPIGLAAARVLPNAIQLGTMAGSPATQSALARAIFADHVFCLAAMVVFTASQIVLAGPQRSGVTPYRSA
jgi:hypothetical protein